MGFALGIMAIWTQLGTLNMQEVFAQVRRAVPHEWQIAIALLIFCGAVGKSAQFPLHVWLPDAMEGPTPVSALIHAATMVNAGVYLVARCNPIFGAAPEVMVVVAAIGIFTAILAASIAFTQTDIKRVLAYSTLSQLGYMFASLGVGAWTAAIFHLMSHGFFKGLLFLDSGSVIHAVDDEQDMRKMGGLAKKIPITYATMLIGSVAIAGVPPLAGLLLQGRDPRRRLQERLPVGLGDRLRGRRHDRVLHVPAHGHDLLGPEPRRPGGRAPHPRVAAVDDPAADPAGHPRRLPGHADRLPARDAACSTSGWRRSSRRTIAASGRTEAAYTFFGIDGALAIATTALVAVAIVVAWRLFGVDDPGPRPARPSRGRIASARSAPRPGPGRACTAARRTSGGSTTSTTCCSSSGAASSPPRSSGSTGRSSTARSTASAP